MIRVLDKKTSDKIAAGEVIERPGSIVKELVENSIDAGASSITVEIKDGGKSYIRVTDDGCGIPAGEAETAFLRHATSKIEKASDLDSIETLGFRGEALASIAAVTRTELITKTKNSPAGKRLVIHGGDVITSEPTGCPDGTTMIVTDLFYNTPARAKFLKSSSAESSRIADLLSQLALTRPDIRFRFINNGKNVFYTSGKGELLPAILSVYREPEYRNLVPLNYGENGIYVSGYVSKPSFSRTNRRDFHFFVNKRVVDSRIIERGVMEGFRERLFEGRYPVVFLYLDTSPSALDVNIHPNKREVRFGDEGACIECVRKAVVSALATDKAVTDVRKNIFTEKAEVPKNETEEGKPEQVDVKTFMSTLRRSREDEDTSWETPGEAASDNRLEEVSAVREETASYDAGEGLKTSGKAGKAPDAGVFDIKDTVRPFDFENLKTGQALFGTYITATDDENFYLIDQHAAHERILYEKLVGEFLREEKYSQQLLTPIVKEVSPALASCDGEWIPVLKNMGFNAELFGESAYAVREIPFFMSIEEADDFLDSFFDSYAQDGKGPDNYAAIDKIITRSCKSAIKAHDYIKPEEIYALMKDLKKCANPFSCPHGRPTFVRFSLYEIERMFKRA